MRYDFDVIVVGAGHAGCEAAHAAARLGASTLLITIDMDKMAQMSCNPAIGGIAKGQIVREIDAMGGMMGIITDRTAIQFRMLNRSKGPAMWSPRAQSDRNKYSALWRHTLERLPGLSLWQDDVVDLLVDPPGASPAQHGAPIPIETSVAPPDNVGTHHGASVPRDTHTASVPIAPSAASVPIGSLDRVGEGLRVIGVVTAQGATFRARQVVLTNGTFLNGLMHIGRVQMPGGRIAEPASRGLTSRLRELGFRSDRMKTGTPVRIDGRGIDFSLTVKQEGEDDFHKFSYLPSVRRELRQRPCYIAQTNERTHDILRAALGDSPLYNGQIQSIGPRYCPSIETKIVTFADKASHQLFIEPEGEDTEEYYLNGFSSSLPMQVQFDALATVPALANAQFYRPGYAIEYDFFDPTQLRHTLETKLVGGLYFAGQINGTTGYEEAAGQGLVAGANAALRALGREQFTLARDESYIGVLIDDLVMKGVDEPYRMFTSRAEYRILLRQDDADMRLTPLAHRLGLASDERYTLMEEKRRLRDALINFAEQYSVKPDAEVNALLESLGSAPLRQGCKLSSLILRPGLSFSHFASLIPALQAEIAALPADRADEIVEAAEILIKYSGYIERERLVADKLHRLEAISLRGKIDYAAVSALSTEARQKLSQLQPETIAQASRIPGVSPADINILLILLGR